MFSFYDVVENGNSAFVGCEVLPKDGYANSRMSSTDIGEHVVEIIALV